MTTCRLAVLNDLPAISSIASQAVILMNSEGNFQWNSDYPTRIHFEKDISDGTLWVAIVDNTVAGFAALTVDQPHEYGNVGWDLTEQCIVPHRLAVSPQFRGRGVAQELMKTAEKLTTERGFRNIRVDTNSSNTKMQSVFLKLGYVFAGQTRLTGKPDDMLFNCYSKAVLV